MLFGDYFQFSTSLTARVHVATQTKQKQNKGRSS